MATVEHTYPLTIPTSPAPNHSDIRLDRAVGVARSRFTKAAQRQRHQGAQWFLDLDFPPLKGLTERGEWEAFFLKLQGAYGNFSYGDPDRAAPQGSISGTPLVMGASQTGNSVALDALPETTAGLLLPGDMISFASYDYMHKVVTQLDSDSSGQGTVVFEPLLRSSPGNNAALQYTNVTSIFALTESTAAWGSDSFGVARFRISAEEAI